MYHDPRSPLLRLRRPFLAVLASSLLLANLAAAPPVSASPASAATPAAQPTVLAPLVAGSGPALRNATFATFVRPATTPSPAFLSVPAAPAPAPSASESNHRIGKAALVFGILGTLGVAAGVVALQQSKTNSACLSGAATTACSDVHKAAKIVIPASAAIAGLGYFFAFHHRF